MAQPRQYNNPFAIIQANPSAWQGLQGATGSGFLIFQSPRYGVRAGFINLVNTYLNRGLNTINEIFPVYAPWGHGNNNPDNYAQFVSNYTGIGRNTPITTREQLKKVGRAITVMEEGADWVSSADFNAGFDMAMQARPWPAGSTTQTAGMGAGAIIVLLAVGGYLWTKYKRS